MNREIKFRAWDNVNKRMGHFEHGFQWNDEYDLWHLVQVQEEHRMAIMAVPCEENIDLMQFTGLKDKNGKEIYDGDIIKWFGPFEAELMQVYWRNGGWHFKRFQSGNVDWDKVDTTEIEVIGNIYQNPELIETVVKV